jgi:CheY-like chemotaxis protein
LKEAIAYRPDLVLLDIGMPTMDGCALARQSRLLLVKLVDHVVLETLWNLERGYVD